MQILKIIEKMKEYHKGGKVFGQKIRDTTTRDQILYGNAAEECTGIITTCWASIDVIKKAHELGANFIIVHEALFWNHGNHQMWLKRSENATYLRKVALLNNYHIVIWRDHDYVHSGIPKNNGYVDGIFYGFAKAMNWTSYALNNGMDVMNYRIPVTSAKKLTSELVSKLHLNGARLIGKPNSKVANVQIPLHIVGDANHVIEKMEKNDIDVLLPLELVDYTASEYVKDTSELNSNKVIIAVGHFNMEEPGMAYMAEYIPTILQENIKCRFIQSGDLYNYFQD